METIRHFGKFVAASVRILLRGSHAYYAWLTLLLVVIGVGAGAYSQQLRLGLQVTALSDSVSWGAYIANFTFCVGLAAAAVMLVIPAYLYKNPDAKKVVFLGEFLAIAAVVMCLLFVVMDVGRPERGWHLLPVIGALNFPGSVMAWDVVVLSGYLVINFYLVTYALFSKFRHRRPKPERYLPIVFISMLWAVSLHTVTAFLYSSLGARAYWNSAVVAPRFLASAFVSGPAFLIVSFHLIKERMHFPLPDGIIPFLRRLVAVTMTINLFLFFSEMFAELYSTNPHRISVIYMLFGVHGHNMIVPFIWAAILFNLTAWTIFVFPKLAANRRLLTVACVLGFVGVWIEKGMGLVVPGFVPDTLGEIHEYWPSLIETLVCAGVWAAGLFVFTVLVKVGTPIEQGEVSLPIEGSAPEEAV